MNYSFSTCLQAYTHVNSVKELLAVSSILCEVQVYSKQVYRYLATDSVKLLTELIAYLQPLNKERIYIDDVECAANSVR